MEHYSNINNNLIPYFSNKYNLGNNKSYWKDLYVSNIYTNHNFKLELNQKDKLEKNGGISIISDSINKDAFQINIDKGGIVFNSISNTIKTKEYFLEVGISLIGFKLNEVNDSALQILQSLLGLPSSSKILQFFDPKLTFAKVPIFKVIISDLNVSLLTLNSI